MARARYFEVATNHYTGRPMAGVTVNVYNVGTTTPISATIYSAASGAGTLANPLTTNSQGEVEFWLADPAEVDLKWSAGVISETHTVGVLAPLFPGTYVARNGVLASVTRTAAGQVSGLTEEGVAETYTRDSAGRVLTITVGGTTRTVSRNSAGQVTGVA